MSAGMIPFGTAWYNNGAVGVLTVEAGPGISVDATDPQHPIVSNIGVLTIVAGDNITVDDSDPQNPIVASTGVGNYVLVDLIDTNASPINFVVDETDPDIIGFQIRGRVRAGAGGTTLGIRFNGDAGNNYDWISQANDGSSITASAGGAQSNIVLLSGLNIDDDDTAEFVIDLPVSVLNAGSGVSRRILFSVAFDGGEAAFVRVDGSGQWQNAVDDITQISLVAIAGSFETLTRVGLWKITQ